MSAAPLRYRDEAADDRMAGTRSALAYLPQLLVYPLTGFCLPVMVMVAGFVAVGVQSWMGLPLLMITGTWMLHYLVRLIEHTAQGHATPPPIAADVVFLDAVKMFKALCGPLLALNMVVALQHRDAPVAAGVALAVCAFLAPAYLFLIATDGRLSAALNPLRWIGVLAGFGPGYVLLCLLLAGGAGVLGWVSKQGSVGLLAFACCYVLFLTAHLMGFLAYHRRERLDIDVHVGDPEDKRRVREQAERLQAVIAKIQARVQDRDLEGAATALLAEPGGPASLRGFHEDLFERVLTIGPPALIHAQGRRLIAVLLDEKRDARAFEVFEACENRHPHFETETPEQWARIALEALRARLLPRFETLADALERRFPDSDAVLSVRLVQARYCSETLGDDERARALLQPLLARTAHPQHAQVQGLARVLARSPRRS
jgi:hypothetical protein